MTSLASRLIRSLPTLAAVLLLVVLITGAAIVSADQSANSAAAGTPTISGTAQVHETLTANTSDITDADGISEGSFNFQWFANDGSRAVGSGDRLLRASTDSTYVVQSRDEGDTIWVQVWFIDNGGTTEFLDSAVTEVVTAAANQQVPKAPEMLGVHPITGGYLSVLWKMTLYPYGDGGSVITGYKVQWKKATGSWDAEADVSEDLITTTSVSGAYVTHGWTISGLDEGVAYTVRVLATNAIGDGPSSGETSATPPSDDSTLSISGTILRGYAENGTTPVGTYAASGAGDDANITWSLSGNDSDDFSISDAGVLSFSASPDYENPADADNNNNYKVTVNASDGTSTASLDVTVTVTDEDESPVLSVAD